MKTSITFLAINSWIRLIGDVGIAQVATSPFMTRKIPLASYISFSRYILKVSGI